MPIFAATIFLSAFLLFQIQPIVAKMILPWFGGSSSVWSSCMVFFQAELLLGYAYVHWLHEKLPAQRQALVHGGLLLLSLLTLPVAAEPAVRTVESGLHVGPAVLPGFGGALSGCWDAGPTLVGRLRRFCRGLPGHGGFRMAPHGTARCG